MVAVTESTALAERTVQAWIRSQEERPCTACGCPEQSHFIPARETGFTCVGDGFGCPCDAFTEAQDV